MLAAWPQIAPPDQSRIMRFPVKERPSREWELFDADLVSWDPRTGEIRVDFLDQQRRLVFDSFLRPSRDEQLPPPGSFPGNPDIPQRPNLEQPDSAKVLACAGPAGRTIRLHQASGVLEFGLAQWELAPTIEWGSGYAVVSMRSSKVMTLPVLWRSPTGQVRQEFFHCDRWDPLTQRAFLRGTVADSQIALHVPAATVQYPFRFGGWHQLQIPEVELIGDLPPQLVADFPATTATAPVLGGSSGQ